MCGRYTLVHSPDQLAMIFQVDFGRTSYDVRFNVAPTQYLPVIVAGGEGHRVRMMRWGMIPYWADEEKIGARLINARSETAAELPSFRGPFKKRRCIVPASGFFEWKQTPEGKLPYYIKAADDGLLAFAGLWDRWSANANTVVESYTILTTDPNEVVAPIHDRMPVILAPDTIETWLHADPRDSNALRTLLGPCRNEALVKYRVSKRVNRPANDDVHLLEPLDAGTPGDDRSDHGDGRAEGEGDGPRDGGVSPGETLPLF